VARSNETFLKRPARWSNRPASRTGKIFREPTGGKIFSD
jgi:hypothetical protein